MYLVSPEYVNKKPPTQLPQSKSRSHKKRVKHVSVKQKQHPHDKWVKTSSTKLPQPKSGSRKKRVKHVRVKQKQHPHDKWVKMPHEMREADISRNALIQNIADFLQKVLPGNVPVKSEIIKPDFTEHPPSPIHTDTTSVWASPASLPSTSHEIIYETPKRSEEEEEMEVEEAGYVSEPEVAEFSTKYFGSVASPSVSSYAFRDTNVDKDFGIRKEADGTFKIGNSTVEIDPQSNVYVQGKMYEGTPGLFQLLTRKLVDFSFISINDLKIIDIS